MNVKRVTRSLNAEDWVLLGYLAGIAVWWVCERLTDRTSATTQPAQRDGVQNVGGFDRVHLGEQALERIERGGDVTVDRWHGGTVRLEGDLVVDAEEIVTDDEDTDE
jgi:hypothetical protein